MMSLFNEEWKLLICRYGENSESVLEGPTVSYDETRKGFVVLDLEGRVILFL